MKKLKFLFMALLAISLTVFTSCKDKEVDEPTVELEEAPTLAAPGEGKVTIAIRVPAATTCNGARGVGNFNGWNDNDAAQAFTKVAGTETWYQLTITNNFTETATIMFKAVGVRADNTSSWDTQWGENWADKDPEVTFVGDEPEFALFTIENDRQPRLDITKGNQVIYIDIAKWAKEPCAPPVPAGNGKFIFKPAAASVIPAGAVVVFTGNFTEKSWGDSDRTMTKVGDNYEWTGAYPANFEMKVFIQGGDWMEGGNVSLPLDAKFPFEFTGVLGKAK